MEPTATINLTLPQLQMLSKSVGKTRDSELRKLQASSPNVRGGAKHSLTLLDEIDGEIQTALMELVDATT